jgi:hypothetical protein
MPGFQPGALHPRCSVAVLTVGLLDWSVEPTRRCTAERLVAYIAFMEPRVRAATAHNRVVHLRIALQVLGELADKHMFTAAIRRLRRMARKENAMSARRPQPS